MFVLLYIVIPVIIAFFWFAVVTNLGSAQSATEFVLAIAFLFLPFAYAAFLMKLSESSSRQERAEARNRQRLIDDLRRFASDDCLYIFVDFVSLEFAPRLNVVSKFLFHTKHGDRFYNLNEHGYANINTPQAMELLRALEFELRGYLKTYYKEFGGYDPTLSITRGEYGVSVNPGGHDTSRSVYQARLFLGDEAVMQRQEDENGITKRSSLKRI